MAGLAPMMLPLLVGQTGGAAQIGLVMAAFNLGGLAAPLWGVLADRYRLHRAMLAGGLLVTAAGLAGFSFTGTPAGWVVLAPLQGAGAAAAATVANLFVVEVHPRAEWDERIGWLQAFYGGGQVGGLLLAGALIRSGLHAGLLTAAGLIVLALLPARLTTRIPPGPSVSRPPLLHAAHHAEWAAGSPQRHYHLPGLKMLRKGRAVFRAPFGVFLTSWLLSYAGAAAVFALYPTLMQQAYGIDPVVSSAGFAIAAGLGLALYSPAGRWAGRLGAARVLQAALGVRFLAFLGMAGLGVADLRPASVAPTSSLGWLALLAFVFVVLAWSLLSVSGTALAARLSQVGEGEGMGVFNAATALVGVVGAVLGGWAAGRWGYGAPAILAAGGVALGLILIARIREPRQRNG